MAKIGFEGHQFSYDEDALTRYSVIKAFSRHAQDPAGAFDALEELFNGRDDEYADKLGGSFEKMMELVAAIMAKAGEQSKN